MHILVTGGSGLIGQHFIETYNDDFTFTVVTRNVARTQHLLPDDVNVCQLDDIHSLSAFGAVINLAGEPIADKRWTTKQKHRLEESRWETTQQLANKIQASEKRPSVVLSGSAIGYYGRQGDNDVTESNHQVHDEFTHRLCEKWEAIATQMANDQTRVCTLRTGIVLAKDAGALGKMALPFKLGLGGKMGSGKQYMSWIHIDDMVRAMRFLIDTPTAQGAYNFTAPNPQTNLQFSQTLGATFNRPAYFAVPAFVLKLALGETSDLLLTGQKVIPERLIDAGFNFRYSELKPALANLYR